MDPCIHHVRVYLHQWAPAARTHHLPSRTCALAPPSSRTHWPTPPSGGGARPGVYCQECAVALKLIHCTDCDTHSCRSPSIQLRVWRGTPSRDYLPVVRRNSCSDRRVLVYFSPSVSYHASADLSGSSAVCFFGERRTFHITRDIHAKLSHDEQKRNGDSHQHQDKDRPVHGQLRAGGQRAGQVSCDCVERVEPVD